MSTKIANELTNKEQNLLHLKHILVVEDEANLAFNLVFNLKKEGYKVTSVGTGLAAVNTFKDEGPFNLILLDVMLPEMDGFSVAQEIRLINKTVGILMLTAKSSEEDRIAGFKAGVDDYLTKPFSLEELLLRVKRMLMREDLLSDSKEDEDRFESDLNEVLELGRLKLDMNTLELLCGEKKFPLTLLEAKILKEFLTHPNKVLTRDYLLHNVWGIKAHLETRTVDNFIVRLRRYLEQEAAQSTQLISVRGKGYKLEL